MDIFTLAAKLTLDSSNYNKGMDEAEERGSKFGNVLGKFGGVAKGVAVAAGSAVTAAATAIGKVAKSSVDAYKDFQQLEGGIDTIFGTGGKEMKDFIDANTNAKSTAKQTQAVIDDYGRRVEAYEDMMQHASDAYETAGVDANTYMENVTGFSASLIKSVGGDTKEAARLADQAMTDMADNANKMGTDLTSIQNAYQGFAKQNYTMLDNLKLGYGGTRSEMQRLLKDAQQLTGKKYNLNNLADVYEAIHAIQDKMDITGTTSREAATTISGSVGMMKAAWTNLKIAVADPKGDINGALDKFIKSAGIAAKNVIPAFSRAVKGIGKTVKELAPIVSKELPGLITDLLPDLISGGTEMVGGIVQGFVNSIPTLIDGFGTLIDTLGNVEWPSWDEVKDMAGKAWEGIKNGAKKLGGLIFGTKEDGSVDWPDWEDVKAAANVAWDWIKENATKLAGLVFGTKEDGSVDWPDWEDVKEAAGVAWDWIKEKATKLAGLVFGTKEDGTVDWPTWDDVVAAATAAWDWIKEKAKGLAGLIFGTKEDGSVAWPTWDDVVAAATTAWNAIKEKAASIADTLGGLVFGRKTDGSVNWPTWEDVKTAATTAWNAIKEKATDLAGLVFGKKADGKVNWPTWNDVKEAANIAWGKIKGAALDLAGLVFGRKENGQVAWPTWDDVKAAATTAWEAIKSGIQGIAKWAIGTPKLPTWNEMGRTVRSWWDSIVGGIQSILKYVLGIPTIGDKDGTGTQSRVSTWWDNIVKPLLKGVIDFTLGLFNLPSLDEMVAKIQAWWADVVSQTGPLVLNIVTNLVGGSTPKPSELTPNASEGAKQAFDGMVGTNKGLNDLIKNTGAALNSSNSAKINSTIKNTVAAGISKSWNNFKENAANFMSTIQGGGSGGGHGFAKGQWDVPYDNYPAMLHRNEMVLTASQARRYREGSDSGVDYGRIGSMIGASVERALRNVHVYLGADKVGHITTEYVDQDIKASDTAILRGMGG